MLNSGRISIPIIGKSVQTIQATLNIGKEYVTVFGVHLMGNQYYNDTCGDGLNNNSFNISFERYKEAQEYRCFQAEWIMKEVVKTNYPVIIMGDMNDFNTASPLDILCSTGLVDSWWEGGNGYGHTFHAGWMRLRIDYILHSSELKLESIKVVDSNLSDHNPIIACYSLNK